MSSSAPPPCVLDAIRGVDGVSSDLIDRLREDGVQTADDLIYALVTERVRLGSDASTTRRVHRALAAWQERPATRGLTEARAVAVRVLTRLQDHNSALRLAVTGAIRRMEPTMETVDLLASAHEPDALRDAFLALPIVAEVLPSDGVWGCVRLDDGTRVRLSVESEDPAAWFVRLVETTGPSAHVEALRIHAHTSDIEWSERGLLRDGERVNVAWENDVYTALNLPTPAPERRGGALATDEESLVSASDLLGVAHLHTDAGAGSASLTAMADRAGREGYRWAWLSERPTDEQTRAALRTAARNWNLKVQASEPDDTLPTPAVLVGADAAARISDVAPGADVEAALLTAADDPTVRALGHLDARVAESWGTLEDWEPVLAACAAQDTAIEISGQLRRAPFPTGFHNRARALGVKALLGADAYAPDGLDTVLAALGAARRGGWAPGEVLNTLSVTAFNSWLGD